MIASFGLAEHSKLPACRTTASAAAAARELRKEFNTRHHRSTDNRNRKGVLVGVVSAVVVFSIRLNRYTVIMIVIVGLDLAGTINMVISDKDCITAAQCNM